MTTMYLLVFLRNFFLGGLTHRDTFGTQGSIMALKIDHSLIPLQKELYKVEDLTLFVWHKLLWELLAFPPLVSLLTTR